MSTMTLEQISERLRNAPHEEIFSSLIEMADAIDAHLTRQPEVSQEDVERACIAACSHPLADELDAPFDQYTEHGKERTRSFVRAALTAVWHKRQAQEKAEPVGHLQIGSFGGVHIHATEAARRLGEGNYRLYAAPPAERVRVPDERPTIRANGTHIGNICDMNYNEGWNDCRRAMLSAASEASSHG